MPEKCILLENAKSQKQTSNKWNLLAAKSFVGEHLLKGSLLVELTDTEARETQQYFTPALNYKKYSDDSVKLYCRPEQVLQLNECQFKFLSGVKLSYDRYKALNILHWVEKLKAGYGVDVTIPTIPYAVRGVIRYIGPLPGEEGYKFGIELLEKRGQGASDGTFKNTEYFTCDRDCAMFVAMDKLSEPESSKSSQVHETVQPQAQDAPLKLGDKVIFYDENDVPVNGVVRWIGRNKVALPHGSKIVGIETEQEIYSAMIPGSLARMNHMFTLHNSKGVQVFLPIDSVLKVDNDPPNAPGHPYNTRSKDKHNIDPAATLNLIKDYSKIEKRSQKEFISEQRKHHEEIELKRQQEVAAKRQEKQSSAPGKDFDIIDVQKRHYEAARHASKQGPHQQNQQPSFYQGSNVDPTGYGHNVRQYYGSQVQHQNQQPAYNYPDVSHYPSQSVSQPSHPYLDPVAQMAYIPRPGEGGSHPHYNPVTSMPHDHLHEQILHQLHQNESILGHANLYNQQYPTPKRSDYSSDVIPQNRMFI